MALNLDSTLNVPSGKLECPLPNSGSITLFAFSALSAHYLIGQPIKFTFQRVSRAIWLSLAFHVRVKPILTFDTLLARTRYQWMERTRTPLPFMNVPAVVFAKYQHGISELLRAAASLN